MSTGPKIFDWVEYITFAQELNNGNILVSEEASYRVAVSRAYYGAFCIARNYATRHGLLLEDDSNVHIEVQDHYKNNKDENMELIGNNLFRLRRDRNRVDYDDCCSNLKNIVYKSVDAAKKINEIIGELALNSKQVDQNT